MEIPFVCFQAKELCLRVFARYPEFSGCTELSSFELMSDPKYCGKMKVLDKLLGIFRTEHSKALLFSRSTQVRTYSCKIYSHGELRLIKCNAGYEARLCFVSFFGFGFDLAHSPIAKNKQGRKIVGHVHCFVKDSKDSSTSLPEEGRKALGTKIPQRLDSLSNISL